MTTENKGIEKAKELFPLNTPIRFSGYYVFGFTEDTGYVIGYEKNWNGDGIVLTSSSTGLKKFPVTDENGNKLMISEITKL